MIRYGKEIKLNKNKLSSYVWSDYISENMKLRPFNSILTISLEFTVLDCRYEGNKHGLNEVTNRNYPCAFHQSLIYVAKSSTQCLNMTTQVPVLSAVHNKQIHLSFKKLKSRRKYCNYDESDAITQIYAV